MGSTRRVSTLERRKGGKAGRRLSGGKRRSRFFTRLRHCLGALSALRTYEQEKKRLGDDK